MLGKKTFALLFLGLLSFTVSADAFADADQDIDPHWVPWSRYYETQLSNSFLGGTVDPQFDRLVHYSSAVLPISTDEGGCTATFISKQGHLLTARHCLQRCMLRNKIFKAQIQKEEGGNLEYFTLDRETLGKTTCKVKVADRDMDVVIEATSPGLIMAMTINSWKHIEPELFKKFDSEGYTDRGDFAIVRVLNLKQETPCMKLGERSPVAGESVYSLSFPGETGRARSQNSDGTSKYLTRGKVLSGLEENSCLQEMNLTADIMTRAKAAFEFEEGFITNLDSTHGSSGSSVIADRGDQSEVVGVMTQAHRMPIKPQEANDDPDVRYCSGANQALRVEQIRKILNKLNVDVNGFSC